MYLKLSVAGHLTIFLTRTRGPFWSIRPARILWIAVLGTQAIATCIAIFGLGLVTPLGWYWALLVWGYALAWFLVNDRAKLITYWLLDYARAEEKPDAKAEPKPDAKPEAKAKPEAESKPEAKAKPEPEPNPKAKPEPNPEAKPESQPAAEAKPGTEAEPKPEAKADVAALLNTTFGEILVAGLVKDPEDAGRLIAQGIIRTEARIAAAKTPEAEPAPEPEPEAKAKAQPVSPPKAAE
jgi:H+-transporting ATPase